MCTSANQWQTKIMFLIFCTVICVNTAAAVVSIYVTGHQWKPEDALDFVSYGNGDIQIEQ